MERIMNGLKEFTNRANTCVAEMEHLAEDIEERIKKIKQHKENPLAEERVVFRDETILKARRQQQVDWVKELEQVWLKRLREGIIEASCDYNITETEEYKAALEAEKNASRMLAKHKHMALQAAFKAFDLNGDGTLTKEEVIKVLTRKTGAQFTKAEAEAKRDEWIV